MPTIYVLSKNMKIIKNVQPKIIIFTAVKDGSKLHWSLWLVFVMFCPNESFRQLNVKIGIFILYLF